MSGEDRSKDTNFAVGVALMRDDKVFIARRAEHKANNPGRFELVGGHVQFGETLEEAAIREAKEEIQADVALKSLVDAFIYEQTDGLKHETVFAAELVNNTEPVINPDDHSEMRWIGSDEVDSCGIVEVEQRALKNTFKLIEENN